MQTHTAWNRQGVNLWDLRQRERRRTGRVRCVVTAASGKSIFQWAALRGATGEEEANPRNIRMKLRGLQRKIRASQGRGKSKARERVRQERITHAGNRWHTGFENCCNIQCFSRGAMRCGTPSAAVSAAPLWGEHVKCGLTCMAEEHKQEHREEHREEHKVDEFVANKKMKTFTANERP
jgi:hypothetical protein